MINPLLLRLPEDALFLLPSYLSPVEHENQRIFLFSRYWWNFMNTRKEQWKKQSRVTSLTVKYSMQFVRTNYFRNLVFTTVNNPYLQISIKLRFNERFIDLSVLPKLKKIEINGSVVLGTSTID
jgi:hypothetical protein